MKCPICDHGMKEGVIQSSKTIIFTTKVHKFFFSPDITIGEKVTLSRHNRTRPTCKAYHYDTYRKVVMDYADKEI